MDEDEFYSVLDESIKHTGLLKICRVKVMRNITVWKQSIMNPHQIKIPMIGEPGNF